MATETFLLQYPQAVSFFSGNKSLFCLPIISNTSFFWRDNYQQNFGACCLDVRTLNFFANYWVFQFAITPLLKAKLVAGEHKAKPRQYLVEIHRGSFRVAAIHCPQAALAQLVPLDALPLVVRGSYLLDQRQQRRTLACVNWRLGQIDQSQALSGGLKGNNPIF